MYVRFFLKLVFFLFVLDSQKLQLMELNTNGSLAFKPRSEVHGGRCSSKVWDRFHIIFNTIVNEVINNFVKCTHCGDFVEYNGNTTSNLLNHKCRNMNKKSIFEEQAKVQRQFDRKDIDAIRNATVKFVSFDIRPFFAIEGEGLLDLLMTMAEVGSRYQNISREDIRQLIPSRRTVKRHTEIKGDEMKDLIKKHFREALTCPGGFSCTIDIWTEKHSHISYLGMTAHLSLPVNEGIRKLMYLFNINAIKAERLNAEAIDAEIKRVFADFGVEENVVEQKITFISDRGGNIRAALSNSVRLNCYAHLINNLVHAMCEIHSVREIINDASALVRFVNTSTIRNTLKKTLKQHCVTRWNSTQIMLESVYLNYDEVYNALSEKEKGPTCTSHLTPKITCIPKDKLNAIVIFLTPFTKMTKSIEGDTYATIHMVWPLYRKIESYLSPKESDIPIVAEMRSAGLKYFNSNRVNFEPTMVHKVSVFLHPVLKCMSFAPLTTVIDIQNFVQDSINSHDRNNNEPVVFNENASSNNDGIFDEILNEIGTQSIATRSNELQRYIDFRIDSVSSFIMLTSENSLIILADGLNALV